MSAYDPAETARLLALQSPVHAYTQHRMQEQLRAAVERIERLERALKPFAEPHFMGDNYVKFAPRLIETARAALSTDQGGA